MKCVRKIPKDVLIEDTLSFKITKSYVVRPIGTIKNKIYWIQVTSRDELIQIIDATGDEATRSYTRYVIDWQSTDSGFKPSSRSIHVSLRDLNLLRNENSRIMIKSILYNSTVVYYWLNLSWADMSTLTGMQI